MSNLPPYDWTGKAATLPGLDFMLRLSETVLAMVREFAPIGTTPLQPGVLCATEILRDERQKLFASLQGDKVELPIPQITPLIDAGTPPAPAKPKRKSNWPADPEERRLEMLRRQAVARGEFPSMKQAKAARHPS